MTTKDPLAAFKIGKPPNFSKLDAFEGRSGDGLSLVDRVRLRVMQQLDPENAVKLEKRMGTVKKLADAAPGPRSLDMADQKPLQETYSIGDTEYSRNYLLNLMGYGPQLKQQEAARKQKADASKRELLGELKATSQNFGLDARNQSVDDVIGGPAKTGGAEGRTVDTAAQRAGLFAVRQLRQSINSGKRKPGAEPTKDSLQKEALQTFFLAGFLQSAGESASAVIDTPVKLASFLHGLASTTVPCMSFLSATDASQKSARAIHELVTKLAALPGMSVVKVPHPSAKKPPTQTPVSQLAALWGTKRPRSAGRIIPQAPTMTTDAALSPGVA